MADRVEDIMQGMVPELDDLKRKRIFDENEVRHVVRRRREFEYLLQKPGCRAEDYLSCIRYEVALENLRKVRSKALHWKKKTISDVAGIRRMHFIFDRSVKRYKGNLRLWYQYIDFCLRSGSTKILTRVLLRCVKLHPREANLWLLAADRSLKMGQIKAGRTLLLRGLRFMPRSQKLWGEFIKLEVQVARNMQLSGKKDTVKEKAEGGEEKPANAAASALGPWAPACLLLRKATARLKGHAEAMSYFLNSSRRALDAVRAECTAIAEGDDGSDESASARAGFARLSADLRQVISESRPDSSAAEAEPTAARMLWQLWWEVEVDNGQPWKQLAQSIASEAPLIVVQHLACAFGSGAGADSAPSSLLELSKAPRTISDGHTALAVLEALETCPEELGRGIAVDDATVASLEKASVALLRQACNASPSCIRLRLLACQRLPPGEKRFTIADAAALRSSGGRANGLDAASAAQLMTVNLFNSDRAAKTIDQYLDTLLRALANDASPQPLLQVYLAETLSQGSLTDLRNASGRALALAKTIWESPRVRAEALCSLLDMELRVLPLSDLRPQRICNRFEEVLSSIDDSNDEKVEWWVRYIEFVLRLSDMAAGAEEKRGVPTMMDLHWRAMRSVANQKLYTERVHSLLQSSTTAGTGVVNQ